ncbi:PREDICTED: UPF0449 protein C19orf25 homolog [Nanorana parkeri]|uniref:UPF0449 protein C19orf25 homolog n=1 Tax=Nanorana parkeri TaxID=125878 RepID=UPI000854F869|nr:PREDICTED: UPF0449 protein C19orf25 homolog [Nanorana parkeri]
MTSRAKKRIVLPSRPEPPTVEQILEDVRCAIASDPVFACDLSEETFIPTHDASSEANKQYLQSCSYVQLNNKLKEAQDELKERCEVLKSSGIKLESVIEELRETGM